MNRKLSVAFIALASVSLQVQASEYQFVAADHKATTRFCVAAASDDLVELKAAIRSIRRAPHEKSKTIMNSVRCNGQVAAAFARTYSATDTFDYLYKFTEKRFKESIPVTGVEELAGSDAGAPEIVIVEVAGN